MSTRDLLLVACGLVFVAVPLWLLSCWATP